MTNPSTIVTVTCALLMVATPVRGQDGQEQSQPGTAVEITSFVSLGSAASSGLGTAVRWPLRSNLSIELETERRWAEINALNANVSLLFDLPSVGRVTPYVAGGVGLDQFGLAMDSSQGSVVTQGRTAFTLNAGGGIRVPVHPNWGVRTDARWFNAVGRQAPERWRVYNAVTFGPRAR
jgi:opacity protein-like surface antigen